MGEKAMSKDMTGTSRRSFLKTGALAAAPLAALAPAAAFAADDGSKARRRCEACEGADSPGGRFRGRAGDRLQ
jgi:hypothetical protein